MKYVLGFVLIALGLAALALCLTLRSQFLAVAAQPNPSLEQYPLLKLVVTDPDPGTRPPKPSAFAGQISFRIYAIGGAGVFLIAMGVIVCMISGPKKAPGPAP